jgi:outer membrane protein TolC
MRRHAMLWGLLLLFVGAFGCNQRIFMTEPDYDHYRHLAPAWLDCKAAPDSLLPEPANESAPAQVLDPDRPVRYLSLNEAIAIALEQGTTAGGVNLGAISSNFTLGFTSPLIDIPLTFNGAQVTGSDAIRVFALDPAIAQTDVESALSKFDARWVTSMSWQNTDQPVGTPLDTFQAAGRTNTIEQQTANFSTALVKPLPTGGVAGITFNNNYTISNLNQAVNPAYRPSLVFGVEQPLFQGFGVEINQLRATHPGSQLFQFNNLNRQREGIVITRLRFDQQRTQFEFEVSYMLLQVEAVYWNLYDAYWALYSREQAMRQAYESWRIAKARFDAGRIDITDFAQTRGQYEDFRGQRIAALGAVLEAERALRALLGLPVEDGTRLVPIDAPTVAKFTPDWHTAENEAMTLAYSLILGRQELKTRQLALINEKNLLLPDVRWNATWDYNAIGSQLDGSGSNNAFRNLGQGNFNNWSTSIRAEIPLGYRDAHAGVRQARLQLARAYIQLQDQELKIKQFLTREYRNVFEYYERIQAARASREAYAEQLAGRFKQFVAGRGTIDFLLESQRNWANALATEYDNIAQYNKVLAAFEFAKGTLLQYDNVIVSEGGLPRCAQVRAVEHERERSKALVVFEHAQPVAHPPCCPDIEQIAPDVPKDIAGLPALPRDRAPSLPSLTAAQPPVPEITEPMPNLPMRSLQRVGYQEDIPGKPNATSTLPATGVPAPSPRPGMPNRFPKDEAALPEPLLISPDMR